jgi:dihydrofolate reductase
MGKVIATTQASLHGVLDPVGAWVQADGDHGDYSFERQARSGGLVLGRKTYEALAGYWPGQTGEKALIDDYEVYLNPLVSGQRLYRRCRDAGAAERADERSDESIVKLCAVTVCREISEGRNAMKIAVYGGNVHVLGDRGRYGWRSAM